MIRSLYTAATGMIAQQINQDVVANNLANVQTPGFKSSRAEFQDLMYQVSRQAGVETTSGTALPLYNHLRKGHEYLDGLVWHRHGPFLRSLDEAQHFEAGDVGVHVRVVARGSLRECVGAAQSQTAQRVKQVGACQRENC